MNRVEYMQQLSHRLKRLPREDYDKAMEYFNEYFDEAGPENEQQAILDLGSPETAAGAIVMDLAISNTKTPEKNVKRGLKNVWVAILAVMAAPVALPLALVGVILAAVVVFVILILVLCAVIVSAALGITAVAGFFGSIFLLFSSVSDGLVNLGIFLFAIGLSIFVIWGVVILCKWSIDHISRGLAKMIGGKKHDRKK